MRGIVPCLFGLAFGCGGTVVFEAEGGQGGDGGSTSTASAPSTSAGGAGNSATTGATTAGSTGSSVSSGTASASSGPGGCTSHEECPGGLCVFSSGVCAVACAPDTCDPCTPGEVCEGCATSSCPDCADCVAACVPTPPGRCDDDDPCGAQQVCLYPFGSCAPSCDAPECSDPNMVCDECATSSGCGDDDCVGACSSI